MKRILLAGATLLALTAAQPVFAADAPVYKGPAPYAAAVFNWTGLYVGLQAGYGWGRHAFFDITLASPTYNVTGFVGGGTLGYNWQAPGSAFVWGIEGDLSYANIKGSGVTGGGFGCAAGCESEIKWFGTLRGRIGPTFDRLLLFATGGVAFAGLEGGFAGSPRGSATKTGWTLGAGLEWAFAPNWSAKLEYLHVGGLGSFNVDPLLICANPTGCTLQPSSFDVVRAGVNFRF